MHAQQSPAVMIEAAQMAACSLKQVLQRRRQQVMPQFPQLKIKLRCVM